MKRMIIVLSAILVAWGLYVAQPLAYASGGAYGDGEYGSCVYGTCPISITSDTTVSLDILPSSGTKCTIQSDAVEVSTGSSTGYTLTVNDSNTSNSLSGSSGSIAATSATQASPAVLSANQWGYRVDSLASFGSGPTSASSNSAPSAATFAAVPLSSQTGDTLATSVSPANPPVTTTVWYGACANNSTTAGSYTDDVVYTAIIN